MDLDKPLYSTCNWCDKTLTHDGVCSVDGLCYCHIVCAKLYHDNIRRIQIDIPAYISFYTRNTLANKARRLYELTMYTTFEHLPVYYIPDNMSRSVAKKYYTRVLTGGC